MNRRRRLGQHFLASEKIAEQIIKSARIKSTDAVLEAGTGRGMMLPRICAAAGSVTSVEIDGRLHTDAVQRFGAIGNLTLLNEDCFAKDRRFDVMVSNLPYSESRTAIEWLARQKFRTATITVQREFAEKILAGDARRAITVISSWAFDARAVMHIPASCFSPAPRVDSTVLHVVQKRQVSRDIISAINQIFSYRRKKVSGILARFGVHDETDSRIDELDVQKVVEIAQRII